jgi:hypothetical protein
VGSAVYLAILFFCRGGESKGDAVGGEVECLIAALDGVGDLAVPLALVLDEEEGELAEGVL